LLLSGSERTPVPAGPLLGPNSTLVATQNVGSRRFPHPAGPKVEEQIHFPLLKYRPPRPPLNQFLNQVIELRQIAGLDEAISHHTESVKKMGKNALS
jgi:hypothetical protein